MRGYYLVAWGLDDPMLSGVKSKIEDQIRCLETVSDVDLVMAVDRDRPLGKKMLERLPFQGIDFQHLYDRLDDADYLYIRKWQFGRNTLKFFKRMKQRNPHLKILVEIPTYPYDKETFKNPLSFSFDLQDRFWRDRLAPYIDRYVTYSDDPIIFGAETIHTINGIDIDRLPLRAPKPYDPNSIELVAVANPQFHHGYDRVLQGLGDYYEGSPDCDVRFTLVGDSPLVDEYRDIVQARSIQDKVNFAGLRYGSDLDAAFDSADIALGSFGLHRNGVAVSGALKTRESLARGLPLVNGGKMDVLDPETDRALYLEFPSDETNIDIDKIVAFYRRIMEGKRLEEKSLAIRDFARERVTIQAAMRPVIEYLADEGR